MTAEIGHLALTLALGVAVLQALVPLWGAARGDARAMAFGNVAATVQFALVAFAFAALVQGFVTSDFSIAIVVSNSHSLKPMLYKVSGTWGNHEGSLLLWALILALFGACIAWFGGNLRPSLKARTLAVQAMIGVAFLLFMLLTSNPFARLANPPFDGRDLNPLLQDPGLAFHPPFLYLGYVGLSTSFSFAVAALIEGRIDAAWARWVRPWTLAAWLFLTIGIALGSWWAYYELGWGGWWFWDPVENASFMPWLAATALLHSAIVVEKRESLKSWTILLAILGFTLSLVGTFIVRSGIITSVHAFANDPERGVFILLILLIAIGGAMTLYVMRANMMTARGVFGLISRESALVTNNLLLIVSAGVVFVGTLWPLFAELAFGQKLSVGAPFFDAAFTPFMVALAAVLPIGAMLPWKRARLDRAMRPLWGVLALSVALGALVWVMQTGGRMLAPVGTVLAVWLVGGALVDLGERAGGLKRGVGAMIARLTRLRGADFGKALAHGGLGVTIFGIAAITAWEVEDIRVANIGDSWDAGGYAFRLDRVSDGRGPNYSATIAAITVTRNGAQVAVLEPEKRFYPVARMPTTEAAIDQGFTRDVYVVIGDAQAQGGWAVRTHIKPFANWIWAGAILMSLGALVSLRDRRFRLAAGTGRASPVPAE